MPERFREMRLVPLRLPVCGIDIGDGIAAAHGKACVSCGGLLHQIGLGFTRAARRSMPPRPSDLNPNVISSIDGPTKPAARTLWLSGRASPSGHEITIREVRISAEAASLSPSPAISSPCRGCAQCPSAECDAPRPKAPDDGLYEWPAPHHRRKFASGRRGVDHDQDEHFQDADRRSGDRPRQEQL